VTQASLFVAVLGASNKTFVEAFPDQQLASWITVALPCLRILWWGGQGSFCRKPEAIAEGSI